MLQNDPVRNLQYDSEIRIAQQTRVEPIVFEGISTIITSPPRRNSLNTYRIPLPISHLGNDGITNRTFLPISGLEILHDMPSLHIEQTFELNDAFTSIASENRYTIRSPSGEALFAGTENSRQNHRILWGAARPFQMRLLDKTHQETISFQKKFSLGLICCQPRKLEIWTPPGNFLGTIIEKSIGSINFSIENENDQILYEVKGLNTRFGCCMSKEVHFQVFSNDLNTLKGSIVRMWSTDISQYTLNIYFNDINLDVKSKALFLGAAFLIEYMYFQS